MEAPGSDHVCSITSNVDAGTQSDFVFYFSTGMREEEMLSSTSGPHARTIRHRAVLLFEITKGFSSAVPLVDVDHNDAALRSGDDADICMRPFSPPIANSGFVSRTVFQSMVSQRMLSNIFAFRVSTATRAIFLWRL
jgi:hypothetical protein